MVRRRRAASYIAVCVVIALSGQAVAEAPTNVERRLHDADLLAARALTLHAPKVATRKQLGEWWAAKKIATEKALDAYWAVCRLGFKGDTLSWTELPLPMMTHCAYGTAHLRAALVREVRTAYVDWDRRHPNEVRRERAAKRWCPDACGGYDEALEPDRQKARSSLRVCVELSTRHQYWDENSDACKRELAERPLDELVPTPSHVNHVERFPPQR